MTNHLGKSCSHGLPYVHYVICLFVVSIISYTVLMTGFCLSICSFNYFMFGFKGRILVLTVPVHGLI